MERTYPIASREADLHGLCRPSSLLAFLQDAATHHAIDLGVGREVMEKGYDAFWMLVRLWFRLSKPLKYDDRLTVRTWHRGLGGAQVYRDFDLLVDGQPVGEAITSWVMAGITDRRIVRPAGVPEFVASAKPERVKTGKPERVVMPEGLRRWGHRRVRYSDTDLNGHMNNSRYADVACDAVGYEDMGGRFVSEMSINFLHVCFPGEDILVLHGFDGTRHFVRGTDEAGTNRFDLALAISDR